MFSRAKSHRGDLLVLPAGAIEGFSGIPNSSLLQDDKFVIENRRLNVNGDEDFAAHANCGVPLKVLASRAEDDAKKIAVGRRFVWSGRPDLNRRPHAPQALQGDLINISPYQLGNEIP